jgi:hypothetical protein
MYSSDRADVALGGPAPARALAITATDDPEGPGRRLSTPPGGASEPRRGGVSTGGGGSGRLVPDRAREDDR